MSRVALVTGGGTGIGAAIARRLANDGYRVAVTGRRREPVEEVAGALGGIAIAADVGIPDQAQRAVDETVAAAGGLDVLVCNAGVSRPGTVLDQTPEGWDEVIRTNLTGAFLICRAALPHLLERHGRIIVIGSLAGLRASPESVAYCTSKAGLAMLTRCLAVDHGPQGLRVNCIAPGWVRTPMADLTMERVARSRTMTVDDAYAEAARHTPIRRPATLEEVADLAGWLAGPEAGGMNGAVIPVDGGAHVVDVASLEVS